VKSHVVAAAAVAVAVAFLSCAKDVEMQFKEFVNGHVATIAPLEKESALAYWEAATTGDEEKFNRYSELLLELEKVYTDKEAFAFVKRARESGGLKDPLLARTADLLYLRYLGNQIDPDLIKRMVELSSQAENKFQVFRAEVEGKRLTSNDVYQVLRASTDSDYRRKVWEGSKEVGPVVEEDIRELVKLRNEAARQLGYENYYVMSLELNEQTEEQLERIFEELDELTREPFLGLKAELDRELAERYGVSPREIRPWHYNDPFFQEAPVASGIDLDRFYRGTDPVGIARAFFESIGMEVEDILAASDLYEREGKNPHAFCTDIDREGDIRILANMKDDNYWMETILHELGHGVYDKYVERSLPYLLRSYPHLCLTEASAMYFGRLSQDPVWMKHALGLGDAEVGELSAQVEKSLRSKQLIFARWCQTMFHFERALYRDPDQDLNRLWWDIVERYQFVARPENRDEPDWASKIHIVISPVYYHNYMLGELIASQLQWYVAAQVLSGTDDDADVYGKSRIGRFFIEDFFGPGNTRDWLAHVERVTGEPLTARHFALQFVEERH
jgi:peptidyl-dipeptidase A